MTEKLPCILVQNNAIERLYVKVAQYGRDNDITVIDRSCTTGFDINDCGVDWSKYGPVLIYGSVDFIAQCAKSEYLAKYIFNDREAFASSRLKRHSGNLFLNSNGACHPVKLLNEWMPKWDFPSFIKPDLAHKAFNGDVYSAKQWAELVKEKNLPDDLECWISSAQATPLKEWRCWVVNGVIVAASKYKELGKPSVETVVVPSDFLKYSQPIVSYLMSQNVGKKLPPCFTIDVATPNPSRGPSLFVIEMNCINSSGWYGFDNVPTILKAWMDYLIEMEK